MTAFGDVDLAVKGIKAGAFDFILKPWQNAKLHASILSAIKLKESRQEKEKYRNVAATLGSDDDLPFMQILGESAVMKKLKETIRIIAPTDASVLILGENGTGKELVARAIHRHSLRKSETFMGVDMGAIPETLFESELFGHRKGHSQEPYRISPVVSNWPKKAVFSWMKSVTCLLPCRPNC